MNAAEIEISSYLEKFGLEKIFSGLNEDDFEQVYIPKGDILCL